MSNKEQLSILTVIDAPGSQANEVIEAGAPQFNEDNAGCRDSRVFEQSLLSGQRT